MVEFVSYTGEYPNLCRGVLTLCIDGEEVRFGHNYGVFESWKTDGNYDAFWVTGGECGFYNGWSDEYVNHREWIVDEDELPAKYKKYINEIKEVFNANVPYGCCGGCL